MKTKTAVKSAAVKSAPKSAAKEQAATVYFYGMLLAEALSGKFGLFLSRYYANAQAYHAKQGTTFPRGRIANIALLSPDDARAFLIKHEATSLPPGSLTGQRIYDARRRRRRPTEAPSGPPTLTNRMIENMTIFSVVGMTAERVTVRRFIRADSFRAARVRAFKAFDLRTAAIGVASMQHAMPGVGTVGYDAACNATETRADSGAQLRAMQSHAGSDNTGRTMYKPSEASAVRIRNRASEILKTMGLA